MFIEHDMTNHGQAPMFQTTNELTAKPDYPTAEELRSALQRVQVLDSTGVYSSGKFSR